MLCGMASPGKTSVYLTQELADLVNESGLPLAELIRRGATAGEPEPLEVMLRRVVREELARYSRDGEA